MIRSARANRYWWLVVSFIFSPHVHTEDVPISGDFLEFLGSMVESDGGYISPLDLYEYEEIAGEVNEVISLPAELDGNTTEVKK
ncbi:MAG: hypothetical protein GKR90_02355 [Pseudomonadales bacterium]|nr:hypothetical protein [Pseudomonadales bacterium]